MILNIVLGLSTCLVISSAIAFPLPFANKIFGDFFSDGPTKENIIVKRRTFEDNPDRQLKQISISSLVEDLEKNIFTSALSLNKVLSDTQVAVPEIKFNNKSHDDANQSQMLTNKEDNKEAESTIMTATSEIAETIILQTTEKVQQTVNTPTHIIIDRIAIRPHTGTVALIPIFDLEKTKNEKDTANERAVTKITVLKAQTANLATSTTESSSATSSSATTTTTEDTVTTPKSIQQLKEAEEELKEKFAEIEAEPVILSARV